MRKRKDIPLTAQRLRELLNYDPETGAFTWRIAWYGAIIGSAAGWFGPDGYQRIGIDGRQYLASRLAWLYMTGEWPRVLIDHRNGVPSDGRFANLREATYRQNQLNRRSKRTSTSGFKGVSFDKARGRWRAIISREGRFCQLGRFDTAAEAHAAYCKAAVEIDPEFARFA